MPELSAVFVNYRSAALCARAVASLRVAAREEGIEAEAIVVDCASGPGEGEALSAGGADRLLLLPDNRGYSGGLNAGIAAARARSLLLCNADVELRPGSLSPLLSEAGRRGCGAAAPVQFGDEEERLHLPTGGRSGFWTDWRELSAAGRGPEFGRAARDQIRLWRRGGRAPHLTGSILAVSRETLERVGRLDERYLFEYEETEWQDRARAAGFLLRVVAGTRALHRCGASSSGSAEAARRSQASQSLYWRRRYGLLASAWLERARRRPAPPRALPRRSGSVAAEGELDWVALSPNRSLLPFVGASLAEGPIELSRAGALHPRPRFGCRFDSRTGRAEPAWEIGG